MNINDTEHDRGHKIPAREFVSHTWPGLAISTGILQAGTDHYNTLLVMKLSDRYEATTVNQLVSEPSGG